MQVAMHYRQPLLTRKAEIDKMLVDALKNTKSKGVDKQTAVGVLQTLQADYENQLDTVIHALDRCIQLIPSDWRSRMLRQEFLVNHNRLDEAEKRSREALIVDPHNPEYLKMASRTLEIRGKHAEAANLLKILK
jgi:Flp pilus assembly protein TadD